MYPSDPIPPRRIVVSTIGTPSYKTSEYLVKIIQPTLNKLLLLISKKTITKKNKKQIYFSQNEYGITDLMKYSNMTPMFK